MKNIITTAFQSPYGELLLGSFDDELVLCDWRYRKMRQAIDQKIQKELNSAYINGNSEILELTKLQLGEYFKGERKDFNIPLLFAGTNFQKIVWNELLKIPFGKTQSYLNLSQKLNNEKAIRAVASANGANAIAIIVPCHRVVGSNGKLTGYAGGLSVKKKLLELETAAKFYEQLILF